MQECVKSCLPDSKSPLNSNALALFEVDEELGAVVHDGLTDGAVVLSCCFAAAASSDNPLSTSPG